MKTFKEYLNESIDAKEVMYAVFDRGIKDDVIDRRGNVVKGLSLSYAISHFRDMRAPCPTNSNKAIDFFEKYGFEVYLMKNTGRGNTSNYVIKKA